MAAVLDEATKARTKSMQLKTVDYAKELSDQLLNHAVALEGFYNEVQQHVGKEVQNQAVYDKVFQKVDAKSGWFAKAEAGGKKEKYIKSF